MIKKQSGFGLVDTVIAVALLSLAIFVIGSTLTATRLSQLSRERTVAGSIAQNKMEEMKFENYDNLPLQNEISFNHILLNDLYDSSATFSVLEYDADNDGLVDEDIKKLIVKVNWKSGQDRKEIVLESLTSKTGLSYGAE